MSFVAATSVRPGAPVFTPTARGILARRGSYYVAFAALFGWVGLILASAQQPLSLCFEGTFFSLAADPARLMNFRPPAPWLAHWSLMVAAMMAPLALPMMNIVELRSFPRLRSAALTSFLAGHCGTWVMTSIVFYPISLAVLAAPVPVAVLAAAISLIWQFHPLRARMLSASHRTRPFIARGPAAMVSTLSYGAAHGRSCVASCGHLMLPLALADHSLLFMAAMMSVSLYERGLRRFAPRAGALVLAMVWLLHWFVR